MSKKGYMNLSLSRGELAKYEQVIEVDDFVRLLKEKNEIITSLGEIFPGLRAACVIKTYNHREIPNSEIKFYNRQDQQIKLKTGMILHCIPVAVLAGDQQILLHPFSRLKSCLLDSRYQI